METVAKRDAKWDDARRRARGRDAFHLAAARAARVATGPTTPNPHAPAARADASEPEPEPEPESEPDASRLRRLTASTAPPTATTTTVPPSAAPSKGAAAVIHGAGAEAYVARVDAVVSPSASATDTSPPPIPTMGASGGVSHRATALDASVALDANSVAPARSASRENTHRSAPADAGESNLAPKRCVTAPPSPPPTRGTAATTRGAETRAKLDVSRAKKSSVSPAVGSVTPNRDERARARKRRRDAPQNESETIFVAGDARRTRARRVGEPRAAKGHGDGDADERHRR